MRAFFVMALAAGCATGGSYGTVTFQQLGTHGRRPVAYSVGDRHVVGGDLDVHEDQNCIRGSWGRVPLDFCRDDKGDGAAQHWSGASGQFSVTPNGNEVSVSGALVLDTGRAVEMTQDIPVRSGSQWDELRKHPALLAVAATAAEMEASRVRR
jgi:hypothetical protein